MTFSNRLLNSNWNARNIRHLQSKQSSAKYSARRMSSISTRQLTLKWVFSEKTEEAEKLQSSVHQCIANADDRCTFLVFLRYILVD